MSRKPTPMGAVDPAAAAQEPAPETVQAAPEQAVPGQATADPAPIAPVDPAAAAQELVPVRILLAHGGHQPNDVADLSPDEAMTAVISGWGDDDPAAVAYARSLAE